MICNLCGAHEENYTRETVQHWHRVGNERLCHLCAMQRQLDNLRSTALAARHNYKLFIYHFHQAVVWLAKMAHRHNYDMFLRSDYPLGIYVVGLVHSPEVGAVVGIWQIQFTTLETGFFVNIECFDTEGEIRKQIAATFSVASDSDIMVTMQHMLSVASNIEQPLPDKLVNLNGFLGVLREYQPRAFQLFGDVRDMYSFFTTDWILYFLSRPSSKEKEIR